MHLANAVGTRSVIIFGGREDPKLTGYPDNINLFDAGIECSPCWKVEECLHKKCMQNITTDMVCEAICKMVTS